MTTPQPAAGIVLLGLGTVGSAVARRLHAWPTALPPLLPVVGALVRDSRRRRDPSLRDLTITSDVSLAARGDIVVEMMGGLDPAEEIVTRALDRGASVVTANKALVASRGRDLTDRAALGGGGIWYSAAVGGGTPILELVDNALVGDVISSADAVLNGTTNLILSRMAEGDELASALAEAQRRGLAEADATSDTDGTDAAHKLALLAAHLWHLDVRTGAVVRRGIETVDPVDTQRAAAVGAAIRLVASAAINATGIGLAVRPAVLGPGHPLALLSDAGNGCVLHGDLAGPVTLTGTGAGGDPTASAICADIVRAMDHRRHGRRWQAPQRATLPPSFPVATGTWLRIGLEPTAAEAAATVLQMLEDRGISVTESIESVADVVVITSSASADLLDSAIATLDTLAVVTGVRSRIDYIEPPQR